MASLRFNSNLPRYRCCCNLFHITTAIIIISVIEIVFAIGHSGYAWLLFTNLDHPATATWATMLAMHLGLPVIMLLSIALLYISLCCRNHQLSLIHFLAQFMQIIACTSWLALISLILAQQHGPLMQLVGYNTDGQPVNHFGSPKSETESHFQDLGFINLQTTSNVNNANPSGDDHPDFNHKIAEWLQTTGRNWSAVILGPLNRRFMANDHLKIYCAIHLTSSALMLALQSWWVCCSLRLYRYLKQRNDYFHKEPVLVLPGYSMMNTATATTAGHKGYFNPY